MKYENGFFNSFFSEISKTLLSQDSHCKEKLEKTPLQTVSKAFPFIGEANLTDGNSYLLGWVNISFPATGALKRYMKICYKL